MRIFVTGLGIVSPLGRDAPSTMARLLSGERGIAPLSLFDAAGCRSSIAGQVLLSASEVAPDGDDETWSRTDAMAVLAAREALGDLLRQDNPERVPDLIVGGTTAGMFETEDLLAQMAKDPAALGPLKRMLSHPLSATADRMRQVVAPFRRARTVCSACSSGANALLLAASWLRTGRSKRVLAGGADGLCRLTYVGFSALGALSPEPCRPFDVRRNGLNLGEGAAFLLLETEEAAGERGAEPIAELRGWAAGAEAHHITNPQAAGDTAARVMRAALKRGGIGAGEIGYVNAHGTATPLNDKMESAALRTCFPEQLRSPQKLAVSSSKGQIGHTLGAAGAIEAAITALVIRDGRLPPTVGLEQLDETCHGLRHLSEAVDLPVTAALSNSFGFGGSDTSILLTKPGHYPEPQTSPRRVVVVTAGASLAALGAHRVSATPQPVEAQTYFADGPSPGDAIEFDTKAHLDLGKARRLDRAARLLAATMQGAVQESAFDAASTVRVGAIAGAAFGTIDQCSAYIQRFIEKGAKFASPAVFPNLLPSSPIAHASIYLGLRGVVFAGADLGATAESALVTSVELIEAGEADAMLAGGVEEGSRITEKVLGPLCSQVDAPHSDAGVARSEGAAVWLLEEAAACAARGAKPIAAVRYVGSWRGAVPDDVVCAVREAGPEAFERPAIVAACEEGLATLFGPAGALRESAWAACPRKTVRPRSGKHEAAGGIAAVAALSAIATGAHDAVLIVGEAPDRGYVLVLERCRG